MREGGRQKEERGERGRSGKKGGRRKGWGVRKERRRGREIRDRSVSLMTLFHEYCVLFIIVTNHITPFLALTNQVAYHGVPEKAYEVFVSALKTRLLDHHHCVIPELEDHNPAGKRLLPLHPFLVPLISL